jgi:hypothetical protein
LATNVNFKVKNGLDAGGDIATTGIFKSNSSAGDEGGQIDLAKAVTNTTLTTGVSIDVFQNKLRIFETGGTNRGFYLDISTGGNSVATNLASGGGTVTSVGMTVPTGLSISGSPITGSGTLALSLTTGYVIPTTTEETNWNTAYGWGNHASAGYLTTSSAASTYQPLNTNLTSISGVTNTTGYLYNNGSGTFTYRTIAFGDLPTGTTSSTVAIGNHTHTGVYEPATSSFTGKTYNGLSLTAAAAGFTIAGGTTSKTLTVSNTLALSGTDSTTMTFPSTSATIARTDAGQTFTGIQTMTSPSITTSLTTGSSSFDLVNTTATTINLGGAATTFNVGYSGTGASTTNISTGSTTTSTTKTINIGTGGSTASTTNINLGGGTSGQTSTININGRLSLGSGVNYSAAAGTIEYDGAVYYSTPTTTTSGRALDLSAYYYASNESYAVDFSATSTAKSIFGSATAGWTLPAGSTYEFELVVFCQSTFGGTAVPTYSHSFLTTTVTGSPTTTIYQKIETGNNTTSFATAQTMSTLRNINNAAVAVCSTVASGSRYAMYTSRGIIRVTGTGSVKISPAASSNITTADYTFTALHGSYFKLIPLGNGTVTNIGSAWA